MKPPKKTARLESPRFLWAIGALLLLAGVWSAWALPPFRVPDEAGHWVAGLNRIHRALGAEGALCSSEIALSDFYGHAPPFREGPTPHPLEPRCGEYEITYGGLWTYPQLWVSHLVHQSVNSTAEFSLRLARMVAGLGLLLSYLLGSLACFRSQQKGADSKVSVSGWLWISTLILSPIAIQQGFSVSMDPWILAYAVLLSSLLLHGESWGRWIWVFFTAIALVAIQGKPVFAPLLVIPLVMRPWTGRAGVLQRSVLVGLCLYGVMLGIGSKATQVSAPQADSATQMRFILEHPLQSSAIVVGTTLKKALLPTQWMMGRMGWGEYRSSIPTQVCFFGALVLLAGALLRLRPVLSPTHLSKVSLVAAVWLGSASLVTLFLYLVWTPVGASAVEGLQGRYFLPFHMVAAATVCSMLKARSDSRLSHRFMAIVFALQCGLVIFQMFDLWRGFARV